MIDKNYKNKLFNNTFKHVLRVYFVNGIKIMLQSIPKVISFILLFASFATLFIIIDKYFRAKTNFAWLNNIARLSNAFVVIVLFLLAFTVLMILFGKPKRARKYHGAFQRCGMVNSAGESPALIERIHNKRSTRIEKLVFYSIGLPLSLWNDNIDEIESALNLSIDSIEQGKDKQHFVVYAVDGSYVLPEKIDWNPSLINSKSSVLVLGESVASIVEVDLSKIPHLLLGGSTGSGKTLLLKLLLMQCIKKQHYVYVADFKGGVDFNKAWETKANIITDQRVLTVCLDKLVDELHKRISLFKELGCDNIDEYNNHFDDYLPRIIFACDEVAELLDKTGLDKQEKEIISKYESNIATIARLGRAFGVHLILATQRPDANIISGQIKSNIDMRICGRADDTLSRIILDKTDAKDLISKNAQGRFLTNSDELFQAYYFDDSKGW